MYFTLPFDVEVESGRETGTKPAGLVTYRCRMTRDEVPASTGPLAGVRVVDLCTVVMAPMAARILGDLGADVIKVESADSDFMRDFVPKRNAGMGGITMNLHRNKRSMQLDLKSELGHKAMLDLVTTSDVFMTNMRPAALARLNLTADDLVAVQPSLVYCGAVGFGSDGPYAGRAAYDDVIQSVSGMATMRAWSGQDPTLVSSTIADKIAALHIVYAVLAGLVRKGATGAGDVIEVPMAEALASFNLVEHLNGHTFEPKMEPFSYQRLQTEHRRPQRSKDGWIHLLPYSTKNYFDIFVECGRPELVDDERFATVNSRVANIDPLYGLVHEFAATKTTAEWMAFADANSIPCMPVNQLNDLESDPHFAAVGLFEPAEHPTEGAYRVIKDPVSFASDDSPTLRRHAPRVGQHTAEVLGELGWADTAIADVIGDEPSS
jgi:crotonobetainyl-CoA:carnitine CoA-transferase CaiB-like acyl-CoA transferase